MAKKSAAQIRSEMTEFCVREAVGYNFDCYIAALTSVAHLCDQVSREAARKAERDAAKNCGDFIWSVADAVKAKREEQKQAKG